MPQPHETRGQSWVESAKRHAKYHAKRHADRVIDLGHFGPYNPPPDRCARRAWPMKGRAPGRSGM
jgi:hypothetical protein